MLENPLTLLLGPQGGELFNRLYTLYQRFPHLFPKKLFLFFSNFLSHCSEHFLQIHDSALLSRILFSQYRLLQKGPSSLDQKINISLFEINPSTFGISIALFSRAEEEQLNEKEILKGLQNILSGIKPIPHSYLFLPHHENRLIESNKTHLYYLEIEKIRGGLFYPEDREILTTELPRELKKGLEKTPYSLFVPGNEEELFKNIRHLSQEIKYFHDLPQVMITFTEYLPDKLKFLIIAVRLLKNTPPSIQSLCAQLPSLIQFSLENVFLLDHLRNKYPKEATVFTLEVNSSLFLRNHQAVNLRAARQYIVKALESVLGPLRDYNGGLLCKENEQLLSIKRALDDQQLPTEFLEDLFYSIKPISMRALLYTQTGIELIKMIQNMLVAILQPQESYLLNTHTTPDLALGVIKTTEKSWKNSLSQRILNNEMQIGSASLEMDGYLYLCFFQQYPQNTSLIEKIQRELSLSTTAFIDQQKTILRLNFQAGDPPSLNPHVATDIHCHLTANLLFEGLTRVNAQGQVEWGAAEKVDISPSQLIYTFHLRQSFWSNGEEVTAYHFERSWKKALMGGATRIFPSFFSSIKNAKKAQEKKVAVDRVGICAKDSKTLVVELNTPTPYFLHLIATPPFFPLRGESAEPLEFNGPFTLIEWQKESFLSLSQNPFYWNALQVAIGGIKILMVQDPYVAYGMFKKGELDLIGDPISPLPPEILKFPQIQPQLHSKEVSRIFWIHCNTQAFPLNNAKLRRALSLALNRERIVEKVFIQQTPQISPLPKKYSQVEEMSGNPLLARAYFKQALQELNLDPKDFPTLKINHSDLSFDKPLLEELQLQWKEVLGINLQAKSMPWNEFSASLERKEFQLGGLFRRDFFNNPFFYLGFFKNSPTNPHAWENSQYEELLEKYRKEGDEGSLLKKIEQLLIEEAPIIPIVSQRCFALTNPYIQGIQWSDGGCLDLSQIHFSLPQSPTVLNAKI